MRVTDRSRRSCAASRAAASRQWRRQAAPSLRRSRRSCAAARAAGLATVAAAAAAMAAGRWRRGCSRSRRLVAPGTGAQTSVSFHSSVSPTPAASGERGQEGKKHRKRRSKASHSAAASKWAGPPVSAPAAEGTWSSAGWTLEAPKRSPAQLLTAEKEARGHSDGAGGSQSSDSSPASIRADSPFDAARRELHEMLEGVEASVEGFVTEAKTEDWLIETCSTLGRSPSAGAVGAGVGLRLACATGATDSGAMASPQHRKRRRRTRGGSGHSSPTKSGHSSPTKSGHSSPNNGRATPAPRPPGKKWRV